NHRSLRLLRHHYATNACDRLEHPTPRAAFNSLRGHLNTLARCSHPTRHFQCQRCTDQQAVSMRPVVASFQHRSEGARVMPRVTTCQLCSGADTKTVVLRGPRLHCNMPGPNIEYRKRPDGGRLIPAFSAVNHKRALDWHPRKGLGHELRHLETNRPDNMDRRFGGVGGRTEYVEYRR